MKVEEITAAVQYLMDNNLADTFVDSYASLEQELILAYTLIKFGAEEAGVTALSNIMCYLFYLGYQKAKEESILPWVVGKDNV